MHLLSLRPGSDGIRTVEWKWVDKCESQSAEFASHGLHARRPRVYELGDTVLPDPVDRAGVRENCKDTLLLTAVVNFKI